MTEVKKGNLFAAIPAPEGEELVEGLLAGDGFRVERIVSQGHRSPEGFWYDQAEDEWVALLSGTAELEMDGEERPRPLVPGDWLLIPAHCRHRVVSTSAQEPAVWLAIFRTT